MAPRTQEIETCEVEMGPLEGGGGPSRPQSEVWKKRAVGVSILVVVVLVLVDSFTTKHTLHIMEGFLRWVEGSPALGALAFIAVYIVATVAFFPGSILTLGAGFVFAEALGRGLGFVVGTAVVLVGASSGACFAFLLGRYVLRDWVREKLVARFPIILSIDRVLEGQGLKILILLRLRCAAQPGRFPANTTASLTRPSPPPSPAIPFNAFNYVASITGAQFSAFALACIGMLPGTAAFVFIGSAFSDLKSVTAGESQRSSSEEAVRVTVLVLGIVATVVAVVLVTWYARRELRKAGLVTKEDQVEEDEAASGVSSGEGDLGSAQEEATSEYAAMRGNGSLKEQ